MEHARDARDSLDDVRDLLIDTPDGGHVRLADVADVRIAPAPSVDLPRERLAHASTSSANVDGRDLGAVVARGRGRARQRSSFPLGYHTEVLGEYAERQARPDRLMLFAIVAAIGVFLILLASFGNIAARDPRLPDAAVGAGRRRCSAAYFTGDVISLGSLVGFLTVFGIAARNKIMLINHYPASGAVRRRDLRPAARLCAAPASGSRRS